MLKKVLSFDVGIINLAYCLLEINDTDETFKILKWGIIDLADDRLVCEHTKTNKQTCGKIAKHVLKIDPDYDHHYYCKAHASKACLGACVKPIQLTWTPCNYQDKNQDKNQDQDKAQDRDQGNICDLCDKKCEFVSNHIKGKYCSKHRKTVTSSNNYVCATKKCNNNITRGVFTNDDTNNQKLNIGWCDEHFDDEFNAFIKKKTKNISQNSNKKSLIAIGRSMYQKLDSIPDFLMVDEVYVENQPTFINPTMKSVSAILFSYFIMRGIHEKTKTGSTISNISFCSPSNKIKVGGQKANDKLDNAEDDKVYKITKDLGVKFCKALIDDNKVDLDTLNSHKKQDDMADAFLQGFIMCFGPTIPQHYADKIKTVDCSDVKKVVKKRKNNNDENDKNQNQSENQTEKDTGNKLIIGGSSQKSKKRIVMKTK